MNTPPTTLRSVTLVALLFGLISASTLLCAQTKSAPATKGQLLEISVVVIKPDRIAEYERLQREEVNPALKKAGLESRNFFKGGFLNEGYVYGTAVPIPNLAFFDGQRPLEKALGKTAADALMARIATFHISKRVFATRVIPDMTWGQQFSPVAVIVHYRTAPGRKGELLTFLRDHLVPATRKGDLVGFTVEETVLGGNVDEVHTLGFRRSYAELDQGPMPQQVLGEKAYQEMMQKLPPGVVLERDARVLEFLPDLSFGPQVRSSRDKAVDRASTATPVAGPR
jgi:hypothetical protein